MSRKKALDADDVDDIIATYLRRVLDQMERMVRVVATLARELHDLERRVARLEAEHAARQTVVH